MTDATPTTRPARPIAPARRRSRSSVAGGAAPIEPREPSASARPTPHHPRSTPRAFTLIELILVMALLSTVIALAAPSLARFFRGRGLDSEAHRFLALTRYAQSRAVSEGIPMVVWIDEDEKRYGLQAEYNYLDEDELARQFEIDSEVSLEIAQPLTNIVATASLPPSAMDTRSPGSQQERIHLNMSLLRFTPDGFVPLTNPEWIRFSERRRTSPDEGLWVAVDPNRSQYELRTEEPPLVR